MCLLHKSIFLEWTLSQGMFYEKFLYLSWRSFYWEWINCESLLKEGVYEENFLLRAGFFWEHVSLKLSTSGVSSKTKCPSSELWISLSKKAFGIVFILEKEWVVSQEKSWKFSHEASFLMEVSSSEICLQQEYFQRGLFHEAVIRQIGFVLRQSRPRKLICSYSRSTQSPL